MIALAIAGSLGLLGSIVNLQPGYYVQSFFCATAALAAGCLMVFP